MKRFLFILLIAALLISACGGSKKATSTPGPEPTVTAIPPTNTPEPEPTATGATSILPADTPESKTTPAAGTVSFVDSDQRLGSARSWDVSLGDLDGDGDLDAFVANDGQDSAGNAVWLNDGGAQGGTPGTFTLSEQSLGYGRGIALGDVDKDGDLDAFVVDWDKAGDVWLNDGSGNFADSGQTLGSGDCWDVALGDLDGDGDLDAFTAQNEANTVWSNDGGTFTDTGQRLGEGITTGISLGDLDGDGDLDALAGGWREPAKVWINDGGVQGGIPGTFTDSGQALTSKYLTIHDLDLGDLDGDGDLDAILVPSGDDNEIWLNNGGIQEGTIGTFSDSGQRLPGPPDNGVALGDLDGDGDLDAFVATAHPGDRVWLNDGGLQGGTPGLLTDSGLRLGDMYSAEAALGDLDGDGDLDAFVTHGDLSKSSGYGQPNIIWLNETPQAADDKVTVGLFSGAGAADACVTAASHMFEWMGYSIVLIDAQVVNHDDLTHIDILYFPGGSTGPYQEMIHAEGRDKIRDRIQSGGCFIGTCAGALYAAEQIVWNGSQDPREALGLLQGTGQGPIPEIYADPEFGMCQVNLEPHAITGTDPDPIQILYYNGPFFKPDPNTEVDVVGRYEIGGEPALIAFEYGEGRVFLTGPHPEWEEDDERDGVQFFDKFDDRGSDWDLMRQATQWCLHQR